MAGSWARTRASERIDAICAADLETTALRRQVLDAVRAVVEFDAFVWLLTDPVTTVGVAPFARVPCLPELPALIRAKYATGINRWTALSRSGSRVGLLRDAVGGKLSRSRVWREVMSRYGVGDVASVVFADRFGCWGFLDLWRDDSCEPFSGGDAEFLARFEPAVTMALRRCQSRAFVEVATPHRHEHGPVVVTLDDDLRIIGRTSATKAWLDRLLPPVPDEKAIPASIYNVGAQLLAAEAGVDDHPASARVHLADGYWLTVRAARLALESDSGSGSDSNPGSGSGSHSRASGGVLSGGATPGGATPGGATLVVTIEATSAAERLELFARTFGLTPREDELLGLLAIGGDTRAIARRMAVSELTVQDHLKSIFGKTGVHDRITVLSRALGTRRGLSPEDCRQPDCP